MLPELIFSKDGLYQLPPLPYPYDSLEPAIDKLTMEIHHQKHHGGYVSKLNQLLEKNPSLRSARLETAFASLNQYSESIRTELRNQGGGHWNHTLFWTLLKPGGSEVPSKLESLFKNHFGDIENFKAMFAHEAKNRFGSGWAWLIQLPDKKYRIISTPNQDNPLMSVSPVRGKPLLALDVWEHAYYLNYQNRRADYIDAFWKIVNWEQVAILAGLKKAPKS
ncbi:MAG: superoxide dismutase [Bacteroidia bacterium]|nr:superoxide dismutase [Bacteroidia bacterium]